MSPKGLADWTGKTIPVSCWFRCKQGPANLRCSLESSACFSGLCILDFSILYFYFWCLIFGRLNEDLRKQWGLTWYKIDLIVLLKILNDRLTVECVRPLVHTLPLLWQKKKKLPSYTDVQHTVISYSSEKHKLFWRSQPSPSSRLTMPWCCFRTPSAPSSQSIMFIRCFL